MIRAASLALLLVLLAASALVRAQSNWHELPFTADVQLVAPTIRLASERITLLQFATALDWRQVRAVTRAAWTGRGGAMIEQTVAGALLLSRRTVDGYITLMVRLSATAPLATEPTVGTSGYLILSAKSDVAEHSILKNQSDVQRIGADALLLEGAQKMREVAFDDDGVLILSVLMVVRGSAENTLNLAIARWRAAGLPLKQAFRPTAGAPVPPGLAVAALPPPLQGSRLVARFFGDAGELVAHFDERGPQTFVYLLLRQQPIPR